jgi:hypothetical protein
VETHTKAGVPAVKVQWLINVAGMVHNNVNGVQRGDVMDVDDVWARGYVKGGYAVECRGKPLPLADLPPPYRPG